MILARAVPIGTEGISVDLDAPDARDAIMDLYRPPRADWVRLNLIGTVSGSATGPDGTSDTITNAVDRVILNVIRSLADVVLVGASSVRAEGYYVPRDAALAVVTRSGDFTGHRIVAKPDRGPIIVLCPATSAARVRATIGNHDVRIIVVPDVHRSLSADAIITALREAGYPSIVVEGGPSVAAHLAIGGVVDELCLTTSPQLNGATLPLFGGAEFASIPLALDQLLVDQAGFTYARWALGQSA